MGLQCLSLGILLSGMLVALPVAAQEPAPPPGSAPSPPGAAPAAPAPSAPAPSAPVPGAPAPTAPAPYPPPGTPGAAPPPPYPPPAETTPGAAPPQYPYPYPYPYPPPPSAPPPAAEAPPKPEQPPKPRYELPEGAAVQSSPFFDATVSLVALEDRITDPIVFGLALGGYIAKAVRIVGRLEMPTTSDRSDEYIEDRPPGFEPRSKDDVTFIYGGALGVVVAHTPKFVFAPGVSFLRTDIGEFGNMVGVSLPFEWTNRHGMRFGFELDVGRVLGGSVELECVTSQCTPGQRTTLDRPDGRAVALRFNMGFGFNHPPAREVIDDPKP